ncbi:MAG: hypothetical protein ABSF69_16530 [Polyangiaceae bacterium]|jgi:hypothetical protein
MKLKFLRWLAFFVLVGSVCALSSSCAESRPPINRVQAGALDKGFFVGPNLSDPADDPEFYFGTRIIGEPYGLGQDFAMFQAIGSLARVKWEIQENLLVARLTYDRIANSGYNGATSTTDGQIVAEFNIQSQFDIIHDYNLQTGEQLNVIVENTTDRPWYERQYFRVDWSKNLVTDAYDFDLFSVGAALDGLTYSPVSYYIEDPSDPNAPVFNAEDGYFDVTTMLTANPQIVNTPYGNIPVCWLFGSYPAITCDPAEVTIRLSFKKVVDDDYEPENWDGNKMNAFGFFTVDRFGYTQNYGILDQNWNRFITRYNIWQGSHITGTQCAIDAWRDANGNVQNYQVDASGNYLFDSVTGLPIPDPAGQPFTKSGVGANVHRDTDQDGTEDECEFKDAAGDVVNPGSRCDEFTNKCDIPLYLRNTKTTPFYIGPTADPDLFATTSEALNSWNIAVKRAVQLGKVVEANRVGAPVVVEANGVVAPVTQVLTTEAQLLADQQNGLTIPDIFVLCHNPVVQGDSPACGAAGLAVRLGDLRYNVVDLIANPQLPSAWGIDVDFDDPLTGEKVQSSINEWIAVLDTASQSIEDLIRWLNGEITNQQIADGQYLSQWASGSQMGLAQYSPSVLSTAEIASRINSIDTSMAQQNGLSTAGVATSSPAFSGVNGNALRLLAQQTKSSLPLPIQRQVAATNLSALGPTMDSQFEAIRGQLIGSTWETQLVTPDVLQWAGFNPQEPIAGSPTTLALASPLQGLDPQLRKWSNGIINTALVQKDMSIDDGVPEPDSLVGLARQAQMLFPAPTSGSAAANASRDAALYAWIRQQLHLSVIAHEMGHSMGLRHNFAGSFDALNYHTEYWQLRTQNGTEHYCGYPGTLDATTPQASGGTCVGPRWVDPVTDQEANDFIWKWGSTSVMDYPGDQTQDMNDIGSYDKAAMRFGYADLCDVETNMTYTEASGVAEGGRGGLDYLLALDGFNGVFGNSIGGNHYSTYADKYPILGTCTPRPGWTGDPSDPLAQQCSGPDLDYVATRDMLTVDKYSPAVTAVRPDLVANFAVDSGLPKARQQANPSFAGRVRHPYMFGGDEYADVGNVPLFRFDAGADSYEQMQFFISTYENRYIFNNFRRSLVLFNTDAVVKRIETRYFDKVQQLVKTLALGVELDGAAATSVPGELMPLAMAGDDGLAMFVRAMTRPAPGSYVVTPAGTPATGGPPNAWGGAWQLGNANSLTAPISLINVALGNGQGRYIENNYDYTQGYWWSEYQSQVGSYYEKVLAPMYLTEAYNQFVLNSEDDYVDGRYKNLNFASVYPNQIRRLFANLMANQSATQVMASGTVAQIFTLAPYSMPATTGGALTPVQYLPWDKYDPTDTTTTSLAYPAGSVLLDPLVGWEQEYPALISLFWFGPTTLTMNLIDQMRIFSPGDAASLSIPTDQLVAYRDPLTGIEYVAKNYGTEVVNPAIGFDVAKTIGARMIQYANTLAQIAYQVVGTPDPVSGELTYAVDAQGNSIANTAQSAQYAATMLTAYASNLDVVRQLTLFFGYGPIQ